MREVVTPSLVKNARAFIILLSISLSLVTCSTIIHIEMNPEDMAYRNTHQRRPILEQIKIRHTGLIFCLLDQSNMRINYTDDESVNSLIF